MAAAKQKAGAKPEKSNAGGRAASSAGRRMNPSLLLVFGVLGLPLVGVLFPTCLVLGAGMLPTAVAYLFDRAREKYLVLSVAMLNFCGILPAVTELWARGQSISSAAATLADPLALMIAYGAGALGWFLHMGTPPIVSVYYEQSTKTRVRQLATRQKTLVEIWGEDVKHEAASETAAATANKPKGKADRNADSSSSELDTISALGH